MILSAISSIVHFPNTLSGSHVSWIGLLDKSREKNKNFEVGNIKFKFQLVSTL